ncbi:MAG: transposase [Phycisphaeraceae bacterium]
MQDPLAYFLTFHTYGSWLHGRREGSVDYRHRSYGQAHLPPDDRQLARRQQQMKHPEIVLDAAKREAVFDSIQETCGYRDWNLWALHVRENHVHAVVTAINTKPEKVLSDLKAYATRKLRKSKLIGVDRPLWSEHGSTRYLWDEAEVYEKCDYTLNQQGQPMQRFPEDGKPNQSEHGA